MGIKHIFIIPDADRRHARRQYLTDLFRQSPKKFRGALNGFPNENRLSEQELLKLEERIKEFAETGEDPLYKDNLKDILDTNKILVPLDYLIDSYNRGGEIFDNIIKYVLNRDICNTLSIYGLQKRNLERTDEEVYAMLKVEPKFFRRWAEDKEIISQCNFKFVGDKKIFDLHKYRLNLKGGIEEFVNSANELEAKACGDKLKVYILAPYDSEWEINQAIINGKFNPNNLVVKEPVDLIIRSGNAKTPISGGLPYQTQFSQFISIKEYFPDLTMERFQRVLNSCDNKERESGV